MLLLLLLHHLPLKNFSQLLLYGIHPISVIYANLVTLDVSKEKGETSITPAVICDNSGR